MPLITWPRQRGGSLSASSWRGCVVGFEPLRGRIGESGSSFWLFANRLSDLQAAEVATVRIVEAATASLDFRGPAAVLLREGERFRFQLDCLVWLPLPIDWPFPGRPRLALPLPP